MGPISWCGLIIFSMLDDRERISIIDETFARKTFGFNSVHQFGVDDVIGLWNNSQGKGMTFVGMYDHADNIQYSDARQFPRGKIL
jgi:hypothetical protein